MILLLLIDFSACVLVHGDTTNKMANNNTISSLPSPVFPSYSIAAAAGTSVHRPRPNPPLDRIHCFAECCN
jgi:hypothetical protein